MTSMLESSDDGGDTIMHMSLNQMNESLFQSIIANNIDRVHDLLKNGADVTARYYIDRGLLLIAGDFTMNAIYDYADLRFDTPLLMASRLGHSEIVRELLKHEDLEVNARGLDNFTSLMVASFCGYVEVVRELLKHENVQVNAREDKLDEEVDEEREVGEPEEEVLKELDDDEEEVGLTPLILASANDHLDVVRELLIHKNINVNDKQELGFTALMAASQYGCVDVVRELLEHNIVHVSAETKEERTSNSAATQYGDDVHGVRDTDASSCKGQSEVVRELSKQKNLDVNAQDKLGRTAFLWASYKEHWDIVREFLKHHNVDVNAKGSHGNTALIWATLGVQLDVVHDILKHKKVDVTCKNKAGSTALDIARKCELFDIASLLERNLKQSSSTHVSHASMWPDRNWKHC
ncbi:hypothetical protein MHU86_15690 [Fragilaria crotonensis]|nr:hypothetical protein MHU86_15690 [Fragilaria crotonensis]